MTDSINPEPRVDGPPDWAQPEDGETTAGQPLTDTAPPAPVGRQPNPSAEARQAISTTRTKVDDAPDEKSEADGGARADDIDAESDGLDGAELLQQALGAQVIEEIPHS